MLGGTLLAAGCGWVGIKLLDLDGGPPVSDDSGAVEPDLDAGVTDTSTEELPDTALPDASADGGAPSDAQEPDALVDVGPQPCDFAGTWAARVTIQLVWSPGTAIASGSGTADVWLKYQAVGDGSLVPGSLAVCGVTMPDFSLQPLLGAERYGVDFNIPLFDGVPARAASTDATLRVEGAGFPGDAITLSETVQLLGTTLANPIGDPWPSASALASNDMDGDGKPGVTVANLNDATHIYMRVDALGVVRADRGYYASRVAMSWRGSVLRCSELAGSAEVTRFDTHFVGCRLVSGGDCSAGQRTTLDGFRPIHRAESASFRSVKLADGATCTVARSTLQ